MVKTGNQMRAALVINPVTHDRQANLKEAVSLIAEAAARGASLVLLGEMAVTGMVNNDDPRHDLPLAESIPGSITHRLAGVASELGVWLGFGLLERDGTKLYDTALLVSPTGAIAAKYRRVQPQWHGKRADPQVYCQGTDLSRAETDFGTVTFLICGDLFDDELRRQTRGLRPNWILHPFARCFPDGSRDQGRWNQRELPEYQCRVAEIGVPLLATSYVCHARFSEEADAFGGAMALDRSGKVLAAHPLNQTGILYFSP
jgi:N-carbamoylputrescine amidase